MRRTSLIAVAALAGLLAAPLSQAQAQATDEHPIVGSWSLNVEKSSFDPGQGPQGVRRVFGVDDEGFLVSVRVTLSQAGNPSFAMARARLDGGDYPVWTNGALYGFISNGTQPTETASFEVVNARTLRLTQKNAEGAVAPLSPNTWEVSSDGSTLTVTTTGTNPNGAQVRNVEVYDRVVPQG